MPVVPSYGFVKYRLSGTHDRLRKLDMVQHCKWIAYGTDGLGGKGCTRMRPNLKLHPGRGHPGPRPRPRAVPDLSGDGDGASVPDLSGGGDAPPSPSPICPESGTLPRPRPRFAEIGDQAVVLAYPKGVEVFA